MGTVQALEDAQKGKEESGEDLELLDLLSNDARMQVLYDVEVYKLSTMWRVIDKGRSQEIERDPVCGSR